jgi:hypothetical protein
MTSERSRIAGRNSAAEPFTWLEERYQRGPARVLVIAMVVLVLPLMVAMSFMIIVATVFAFGQAGQAPALYAVASLGLVGVLTMVWANVVMVRMTVTSWKYAARGDVCLRVDESGIHTRHGIDGRFHSLRWEEVGTISVAPGIGLSIEHVDPTAWSRRQSLVRRLGLWQIQRKYGVIPALSCWGMRRGAEDVARELLQLRDLKRAAARAEDGPRQGGSVA